MRTPGSFKNDHLETLPMSALFATNHIREFVLPLICCSTPVLIYSYPPLSVFKNHDLAEHMTTVTFDQQNPENVQQSLSPDEDRDSSPDSSSDSGESESIWKVGGS